MSSLNDLAGFDEAVMRFDASWSYDPISGRYRAENGRFMSKRAVEALVTSRIDRLGAQLRKFTRMLSDGNITLDQWQVLSLANGHRTIKDIITDSGKSDVIIKEMLVYLIESGLLVDPVEMERLLTQNLDKLNSLLSNCDVPECTRFRIL